MITYKTLKMKQIDQKYLKHIYGYLYNIYKRFFDKKSEKKQNA